MTRKQMLGVLSFRVGEARAARQEAEEAEAAAAAKFHAAPLADAELLAEWISASTALAGADTAYRMALEAFHRATWGVLSKDVQRQLEGFVAAGAMVPA